MASTVGISLVVPAATADDLDRQRARVSGQLAQSEQELSESTRQLRAAAAAVRAAQLLLSAAEDRLATTRRGLQSASARDAALAVKLQSARTKLARAKAAVAAGERELDAEFTVAGNMVRDQYQQQTHLLPMAVLLSDATSASLQTRLQWGTTMLDTTQSQIDRLTVLQRALKAQRARQAELEQEVAADRADAAANLVKTKKLERQAAAETRDVAALVSRRTAARTGAAVAVAADRREVSQLNAERVSVERRIAVRIAKAKAEAARQAQVARAARLAAQQAAAKDRAQRLRAAERASKAAAKAARVAARERSDRASARNAPSRKSVTKSSGSVSKRSASKKPEVRRTTRAAHRKRSSSGSSSGAHHGFIYPVNGPMTSPYGRRFHPVLHVWKLHDGTDFSAGCGTPIRAAYSGRVAERYFNGAYGNRLMIDHGVVAGRYVTTGYNHAQRYTVGVGQRVSKGQVVGYVGSTGYSTGCHLHLMIWLDGSRSNPMSWY